MPKVDLTIEESWKLRALAERRARAQVAMQAAQAQVTQSQMESQRAESAISAALVAASTSRGGPSKPEEIAATLPPDDSLPVTIGWQDPSDTPAEAVPAATEERCRS